MEFSTEELNLARDRLYQNVIDYFLARNDLEALYVQGSIAAGTADKFSDIDLRVVINPKAYQRYISERFDAPKQWGEWIYNEWGGRSWVCVSHFKPFNKIDVLYFKPEELQPSPWFLLPTEVIYDPKGLVQQVVRASAKSDFSLLTGDEVERLISKGLAYAEEVYRRVMRNELFYAQSLLDSFRWILIQFDDYLQHSLPSSGFGSPSHFERRGSQATVELLKNSYAILERQSILEALKKLLQYYRDRVIQLHKLLSLKRSLKVDLDWLDTISKLCDSNL